VDRREYQEECARGIPPFYYDKGDYFLIIDSILTCFKFNRSLQDGRPIHLFHNMLKRFQRSMGNKN
jgi:hypothetical protein